MEVVLDAHALIGEGPTWEPRSGTLLWVDILSRTVHRFQPRTGASSAQQFDQQVGFVTPRHTGGMLLGLQDGFWLTEIGDSRPRRLAAVEPDDPDTRLNDGKCDRAGRVWAGTMAHDARPRAGSLYRLEADGRVSRMFRAVSISNGIAWSPDNRTMYFIDSAAHGIDALDYNLETGTATRRRRIISIPSVLGLADGMTIDTDGYLWVAMYGGWVVHRYSPGGALDRVIRLPVSKVTSCIFGGDDLGDLYITSAASGLDEAALRLEPLAGGLFRCRPGPTGIAEVPFGG